MHGDVGACVQSCMGKWIGLFCIFRLRVLKLGIYSPFYFKLIQFRSISFTMVNKKWRNWIEVQATFTIPETLMRVQYLKQWMILVQISMKLGKWMG